MSRIARIVVPGCVHHVTQRGNHRQTVFSSDESRRVYLDLLRKYLLQYSARLVGHCLMGNHVHLVPIPERKDSLAKAIGQTHQDYARWLHIQRNQIGHLWQNRYFSCPVSEERILGVLAYVELNPVRAGLVEHAWDWDWSSARAHVTGVDPTGLLDMQYWVDRVTGTSWRESLAEAAGDRESLDGIRAATHCGRPWGDDQFLAAVELRMERNLRPQKRGRKPARKAPE